jgi:hypothetical protein
VELSNGFHSSRTMLHPHRNARGVQFLNILSSTYFPLSLIFYGQHCWCEVVPDFGFMALICISLISNFICKENICISSLKKYLFKLFSNFFYLGCLFFLLSTRDYSYIAYMLVRHTLQIFYLSLACVLAFLI